MSAQPATIDELRPEAAVSTGVRDKIKNLDELAGIVRRLQAQGETVVLAHGTFDLLHMGHVRHLENARREIEHRIDAGELVEERYHDREEDRDA